MISMASTHPWTNASQRGSKENKEKAGKDLDDEVIPRRKVYMHMKQRKGESKHSSDKKNQNTAHAS